MNEKEQNLLNSILQVVSGKEERIDELKLKTLKSYRKKANKGVATLLWADNSKRVFDKRTQGISGAEDRIQDIEYILKKVAPNLKSMKEHNKDLKKIEEKEKLSTQQIQDMIKVLEIDVQELKKGNIKVIKLAKNFQTVQKKILDSHKIVIEHSAILRSLEMELNEALRRMEVSSTFPLHLSKK
tara:strand:+ start:28928 stop:29479 length:552 start_codon:yes stop_codon:yes gene_type:complete